MPLSQSYPFLLAYPAPFSFLHLWKPKSVIDKNFVYCKIYLLYYTGTTEQAPSSWGPMSSTDLTSSPVSLLQFCFSRSVWKSTPPLSNVLKSTDKIVSILIQANTSLPRSMKNYSPNVNMDQWLYFTCILECWHLFVSHWISSLGNGIPALWRMRNGYFMGVKILICI